MRQSAYAVQPRSVLPIGAGEASIGDVRGRMRREAYSRRVGRVLSETASAAP